MDWQLQLISLYVGICKEYKSTLCAYIARISNHIDLSFSDEEVLTIYLFGVMSGYSTVKKIYQYADRHLRDWFPKMSGYTAFVIRLNKISHLFEMLVSKLIQNFPVARVETQPLVMDSLPIILAHRGRRFKARSANEIATSNGYCATKKLHYYGVKLHLIGDYKVGSLPIPKCLGVTDAGCADIRVLDEIGGDLPENVRLFGDKAYQRDMKAVANRGNYTLFTPVKKRRGQEILDSADRLLSSAVSTVRQPVESIFNWIQEKTGIQIASKVRSFEGLMVHIYGKIAAALYLLKEKFCS